MPRSNGDKPPISYVLRGPPTADMTPMPPVGGRRATPGPHAEGGDGRPRPVSGRWPWPAGCTTTIGRILAGTVQATSARWLAWNTPWASGCGPNTPTSPPTGTPTVNRPPTIAMPSDT